MTPADLRALLNDALRTDVHVAAHLEAHAVLLFAAVNHLPALLALWEAEIDRAAAKDEYVDAILGADQDRVIAANERLNSAENSVDAALQVLMSAKVST